MEKFKDSNAYGTHNVHVELLAMLKDFHNFCEQNNIKYSLCGGTLLGSIRHNGFIPWDDDIDVMLDRKNYEKLLNLANNLNGYELKRILWIHRLQKISQNSSSFTPPPTIDLFVVDNTPANSLKRKLNVFKLKILQGMMKEKINYKDFSLPYKICLWFTNLLGKLFTYNFKWKRYVAISKSANKKDCSSVSIYNDLFKYVSLQYPANLMKNLSLHKFEDTEFYITDEYDGYLTTVFGDYMTPPKEEDRIPAHLE